MHFSLPLKLWSCCFSLFLLKDLPHSFGTLETELIFFQLSIRNILNSEKVSFGTLFPNWVEWMDVSELYIMQRLVSQGINVHLSHNLPTLTLSGFVLGLHCFESSRVWLRLTFRYSFTCKKTQTTKKNKKQFENTFCRMFHLIKCQWNGKLWLQFTKT